MIALRPSVSNRNIQVLSIRPKVVRDLTKVRL